MSLLIQFVQLTMPEVKGSMKFIQQLKWIVVKNCQLLYYVIYAIIYFMHVYFMVKLFGILYSSYYLWTHIQCNSGRWQDSIQSSVSATMLLCLF